jgi:hypothetical protein
MDEDAKESAFLSALVTEHFVLQSSARTTVSQAAARCTCSTCRARSLRWASSPRPRGCSRRSSRPCLRSSSSWAGSRSCGWRTRPLKQETTLLPLEIVDDDAPHPMGAGGDRHHPAGDVRQQQVGQGEVPKVVRRELHLEPVDGLLPRNCHDPGVVDQPSTSSSHPPAKARTEARSARSRRRTSVDPVIDAAAVRPRSSSRTARTMWAPTPASSRAVTSPIPLLAPPDGGPTAEIG